MNCHIYGYSHLGNGVPVSVGYKLEYPTRRASRARKEGGEVGHRRGVLLAEWDAALFNSRGGQASEVLAVAEHSLLVIFL